MKARIMASGNTVIIRTPYNKSFVADIKAIPGRRWNRRKRVWTVPAEAEAQAREIARRYFAVEGEGKSQVEWVIIEAIVKGGNTYKRTYPGGVTIDGYDVITPWGGLGRDCSAFQILSKSGGYVSGDGNHAHDVEYRITVRCRKNSRWESFSSSHHRGGFEILSERAA